MLTKLILKLLKWKKLDQVQVLNYLLSNIGLLPLKQAITYDAQARLIVGGKVMDVEQTQLLQTSAQAMKDNLAYRVIKDQVAYNAVELGIHKSLNMEAVVLAKAALWIKQQEAELLDQLAQ